MTKRQRLGPLPELLCPHHDTELIEFICVCDIDAVKMIFAEGTTNKTAKSNIFFQIALAITPAIHLGRRVVLPLCIRAAVNDMFENSQKISGFASAPHGPRHVIASERKHSFILTDILASESAQSADSSHPMASLSLIDQGSSISSSPIPSNSFDSTHNLF